MNRDEIIENLGTIAKSGIKKFVESLTGINKDSQLIGHLVLVYSVFMVAKKVVVTSLHAGDKSEKAVRWESKGDNTQLKMLLKRAEN